MYIIKLSNYSNYTTLYNDTEGTVHFWRYRELSLNGEKKIRIRSLFQTNISCYVHKKESYFKRYCV